MGPGGTVTLLFTDLVGSTELLDDLGDEAFEEVRRAHFRLLRGAVVGGREVKSMGDGLMVAFGSAADAVASALAMQQATDVHNASAERPLGVRIGLNVGDAITEEDDFYGTAVVVAKRLCDRAAAGQVLAAAVVRDLLAGRDEFAWEPLGDLELKGLRRPVPTCIVHRGDSKRAAEAALPALLSGGAPTEFVGRSGQLDALRGAWERACGGGPRLVLVAGDAGIGKTRLAGAFCQEAHTGGAAVLAGRCYEEALRPYQPFVEALSDLVERAPAAELARLAASDRGELRRLLPRLAERLGEEPPAHGAEDEGERHRLFDAVADFLSALAAARPVVLLLDDLHWADPGTARLLAHLLRPQVRAPVMMLATVRSFDPATTPALEALTAGARREERLDELVLGGLTVAETAGLLAAWAGHDVPAQFVAALHAETEGSPLFVGEVLRHLAETGAIRQQDGRWTSQLAIDEIGIPQGVTEVIDRRLGRLDDQSRRVLAVAAVIGRSFELDLLERLCAETDRDTLGVLEEAADAGLVEEESEPGLYRFSHALIRQGLYQGLSRARRARLHASVADELEATGAEGERLAELAHHAFAAARQGPLERAVDASVRAARWSSDHYGYEDAVGHLRRALSVVETSPAAEPGRRLEVLLELGAAEWRAGEREAGRATYLRAAELAARHGDAVAQAQAALGVAGPFVSPGTVDQPLIELLERARTALGDRDPLLRARLAAKLADHLTFAGDQQRRRALADEALAVARASEDEDARAQILADVLWATWSPDNLSERLELAGALSHARVRSSADGVLSINASATAVPFAEVGDLDGYRRQLEIIDRLADERRQPYLRWGATLGQACWGGLRGDLDAAERLATEALEWVPGLDNAFKLFGIQLFWIRGHQDRLDELLELLRAMQRNEPIVPGWRSPLAHAAARTGRLDEAREHLSWLATDRFARLPRDMFWLSAVTMCVDTAALCGEASVAADLRDLLAPYEDRYVLGDLAIVLGSAARPLGVAAMTAGDLDAADRHLRRAREANDRLESVVLTAQTLQDHAEVLLARRAPGDLDEGLEIARRAHSLARDHALPWLEGRGARLVAALEGERGLAAGHSA